MDSMPAAKEIAAALVDNLKVGMWSAFPVTGVVPPELDTEGEEPLGFSIDDKSLKRAGLDYWPFVKLQVHESLDEFMAEYGGGDRRMFLATTKGGHIYTDVEFRDEDMILFGRETAGLPRPFIAEHSENAIRIPMSRDTRLRSLNLANSVNIILFEALRQLGFPDLK